MHIFKKIIIFSIILTNFTLCGSQYVPFDVENLSNNDDEDLFFDMDELDQEKMVAHKQTLEHIACVIDDALVEEFGPFKEDDDVDLFFDMYEAEKNNGTLMHLVITKFLVIKVKIAHAVKNNLSKEERDIVIEMLNNIKRISTTTSDDLKIIAHVYHNQRQKFIENLVTYYPDIAHTIIYEDYRSVDWEKLSSADLRDPSFNLVKDFLCKFVALEDINLISEPGKISIKGILHMGLDELLSPFNHQDREYDFNKTGVLLQITHVVSSQLLDAISS